jgi:hypothetical protein
MKNVRLCLISNPCPRAYYFSLQKKGGKVQKQVQMMQKQASTAGKSKEVLAKEREKEIRAQEKAEEEKRKKENAELFKPVQTQKVPFGVGECPHADGKPVAANSLNRS